MKKFLLITMFFFSAASMMADDGTSTKTLDMSVVTLDFTNATSIDDRIKLSEQNGLEGKPVYDLSGKLLGNSAASLKAGVYIIDKKKVVVK